MIPCQHPDCLRKQDLLDSIDKMISNLHRLDDGIHAQATPPLLYTAISMLVAVRSVIFSWQLP